MKQKVRNRKRWLGILIALAVVLTSTGILTPVTKVAASGYDPASAAAYARQWGGSRRNPAYNDYTGSGGDCMNFVSQCLRAGGLELGGDWQPYTSSWVGVPSFVRAMQARGYQVIENPTADQIYPGNPVIYEWKGKNYWGHATICIGYNSNGVPIVTGHTRDIDERVWNYGAGSANKMCTILINRGGVSSDTPVYLGDNFYAYIRSNLAEKPLTNDSRNVSIRSYGDSREAIKRQIWNFVRQSDGSYIIYSCLDGNVLEVEGAGTGSGANVQTLGYWGHPAQRWFVYGSYGNYRLRAQCTECVLDVANSGKEDGTNIQMCAYNGYQAQSFSIDQVNAFIILPDNPANMGDDFYAYIYSNLASKVLTNDSSNVSIRSKGNCDNIRRQIWHFVRRSDGAYVIYNCLDGNVLDVQGAGTVSGINVQTYGYWGHPAQHWYLYGNTGTCQLQSQCSECILDIANSEQGEGSNVQMCRSNGNKAQLFSIEKTANPDAPAPNPPAPSVVKVSKITLNKTSAGLVKGKTLQLSATVSPTNASNKTVSWRSSNKAVATVTSGGKVTAKAAGTATITCTAKDGSGKKATCRVTVTNPAPTVVKVTGIKLNKTGATLVKGDALTLKATVTPTNASNRAVTWKSSNTRIATVSGTGKVTAKAVGTVTITCTAKDGSGKKATCKITVRNYTKTEAYVARIYTKALGRNPEIAGLKYWTAEINARRKTPVQVAEQFFFAPEFTNKKLNNTAYVKVLYRTFMGREADRGGLNYWVGRLNRGESRKSVLEAFAGCPEFRKIVKSFGL